MTTTKSKTTIWCNKEIAKIKKDEKKMEEKLEKIRGKSGQNFKWQKIRSKYLKKGDKK